MSKLINKEFSKEGKAKMKDWRYNKENEKECKERAKSLVSKMTLEEKVFQTLHSAATIDRLGIKAYNWWNEALHGVARAGVATVFPQAIGLAAMFDEDFIEEVADAISTEARAKFNMQQAFGDTDIYKGLTFWSPNVNIFRDPRWGRGHETFGEDPYLSGKLGVRFIEGLQGHDDTYMKVAACAKHFAVHSGPEDERHHFNAEVSLQDLRETYLPAFETCVKDGKVEAVMGAYNAVNGEPCSGSKMLLQDILREEWKFEGHVVSDCWAIKDFHEGHRVTAGPVESVALAMNQGCDLNCGNLFVYLLEAIKKGLLEEETLTKAVERLFTTRMRLGEFDGQDKVPFSKISYNEIDTKEMRDLNLKAAKKSITLLKNQDNMLPLDKTKIKTIGVIGPNANNRKALVGNYEGTSSRYVTVLEGIQDYVGDDVRVFYSEGCHLFKNKVSGLGIENDRISEVKGVCNESDVIVACFGLDPGLEGEEGDRGNEFASGDKANLNLPGIQEEVLKTIYASGKPVILVMLSGSALAVSWADEHIPAIIQGWYPGAQGGRAIAEVLFGEFSPEGKLPVTFYKTTEELPDFNDYSMKNRTYRYMPQEALYPFGYGLTYSDFVLDNIKIDLSEIDEKSNITCTCDIENLGGLEGAQTIQVYVKSVKENTPNPQLKALKKVNLMPGESMKVNISIPSKAFALYDEKGQLLLEKGEYKLYVGMSQPDSRSVSLTGKTPEVFTVNISKTVYL